MAMDIHGEFVGAGLDEAGGGIVGAGDPVAVVSAGADERFHKGAMIAVVAAGAHEDGVGAALPLPGVDVEAFVFGAGQGHSVGQEAGADGEVDMGCAEVGLGAVGVEVFGRRVAEGHFNRFGPMEEVFGGGAADPAVFFVADIFEIAEIADVFVFLFGEEGDVLGIEAAFGEDGFVGEFVPVNAVG